MQVDRNQVNGEAVILTLLLISILGILLLLLLLLHSPHPANFAIEESLGILLLTISYIPRALIFEPLHIDKILPVLECTEPLVHQI